MALALMSASPVAAWDGPGAVRARLEDEAATAVALLERFGSLLGAALDAAGEGDDDALDAVVAERAWVMSELEPLLASLSAARLSGRRAPRAGAGARRRAAFPAAVDPVTLRGILAPVDEALRHARLLHERVSDEATRRGGLWLVD
jgi:hypothetical protein